MGRKVLRIIMTLVGAVIGLYLTNSLVPTFIQAIGAPIAVPAPSSLSIFGGVLFGLLFYFISPVMFNRVAHFFAWCDSKLKLVPMQDIALAVFGLIITLLIGAFLYIPISRIPVVGPYLSLVVSLMLAYYGVRFILHRKEDFSFLAPLFSLAGRNTAARANRSHKVLDTSAIIDGRIIDICKTGFLEGTIVVAGFVLEELRHIADSPDLLRRNRGRRGLDILNKIQKEMDTPVKIQETDYDDVTDVDSKLVRLAQELKGKVITNDFNLNKVCELQGVPVLNINELANAVKPVVLPVKR